MNKIKLIVTYHSEGTPLKSDVLLPVQAGCAAIQKRYAGMLHDDEGDNISEKNKCYNELTAQYWIWKNYDKIGNPDYVGFMHYRRHFMFDGWRGKKENLWLPGGEVFKVPFISAKYLKHLKRKSIKKLLIDNDVLIIKPYDVRCLGRHSLREQYGHLPGQEIENFDIMIETAKVMAPEYLYEIEMVEHGSIQCLCNMFVMPKNLFFEYNQFLFPIVSKIDSLIDSSEKSDSSLRFIGFLSEFLFSVFIFHVHRQGKYRIKELPCSYILNSTEIILHPRTDFLKYYILSKFCRGEISKKYTEKYQKIRNLLEQAKSMKAEV